MTVMHRGWLHLASGAGVGRVLGFASNLLLTRWMGPTDLGLFNLVTTTVQTSDTLSRCGADYALNFELGGQPDAIRTQRGIQLARGLAQICSLTTVLICIGVVTWILWGHGLFPTELPGSKRLILSTFLILMIILEAICASGWEVLLVSHRTARLALRQGLFVPMRLFFAAIGSLFGGVSGAMCGWSIVALIQFFWLRKVLGYLWTPLQIIPLIGGTVRQLLRRGLPFYVTNLLSSIIFFPLLLKVAAGSGLDDIGYLKAGQILQQLFSFLPSTLVPVLFLKLRSQSSFIEQVNLIEKPLRIIWFLLIEVLLLYFSFDHSLIQLLFGTSFVPALLPTRLLLLTALFECLAQLTVQPLLAAGKTRLYGLWQNGAAIMSAILGWLWIPSVGLAAYLIVRLFYVIIPLFGFGLPLVTHLNEPRKILFLCLVTIVLLVSSLVQIFAEFTFVSSAPFLSLLFVVILILHRHDLLLLRRILRMTS